jgi:hypothetical protein
MSDDQNAMLWNHRPAPRVRRPGETLWTLRRDHVTWSCELRFHGESVGWEAQTLRDGELVIGRTFLLRRMAEAWAAEERQYREMGGPEDF